MKILFICKALPPEVSGGIQTHTWKLSEWLLRLGNEVHILTSGKFLGTEVRENRDGIELIRIPYFPGRKLPFLSKWAEEWAFSVATQAWLKRHATEYDLVHVQGRSGFAFPGSQQQVPVVTTFHGLIGVENYRATQGKKGSWSDRFHESWATRLEYRSLHQSDASIVVSQEMRDELDRLHPTEITPIYIIPNGVDVPKLPEPKPDERFDTLLFIGRIVPIKGVYALMEAMQKVHTPIQLVMIGAGASRPELEKIIAQTGLEGRVHFTGVLDQKAVFAWIQKSFALVLPSRHESQGIVLLEANACNKPVIASRIDGITEVVEHGVNGLLTTMDVPDELAKNINWMYDHPEEALEMGKRGQKIVQDKFSWEKIALETNALYTRLVHAKQNNSAKSDASSAASTASLKSVA
jgi:glycosyltransferase involved in cell wall biosynthesis